MRKLSEAQKDKLRMKLEKLLTKHGSAYAVAKALGKTPQTIYDQMRRLGMAGQLKDKRNNTVLKAKKVKELKRLLKVHKGNVTKVAKDLGKTVQTVYDRMKKAGIKPIGHRGLRGEPADIAQKRAWLLKKIKGRTIKETAKALGVSSATVSNRLRKCEVRLRNSKLFPVEVLGQKPTDSQKKKTLVQLMKQHGGNVKAVAAAVGVTVQSIYEALRRYN